MTADFGYDIQIVEFKRNMAKAVVTDGIEYLIIAVLDDEKPYKVFETGGTLLEEYAGTEEISMSDYASAFEELIKICEVHSQYNKGE